MSLRKNHGPHSPWLVWRYSPAWTCKNSYPRKWHAARSKH